LEIWENYFSKEPVLLPPHVVKEVSLKFKKGAPFSSDTFDFAYEETFQLALKSGPFYCRVQNFAKAAIYKKRVSGLDSDLPNEIYDEIPKYLETFNWKLLHKSEKITVERAKNSDYQRGSLCKLTVPLITTTFEAASDVLFDLTKTHEWESHVVPGSEQLLESLGKNADIYYMCSKFLMSEAVDYCLLRSKREKKGEAIAIICSVDHPKTPKSGFERGRVDLAINFLKEIDEKTYEVTQFVLFDEAGWGSFANLIKKSNWIYSRVASFCLLNIKHSLEKKKEEKIVEKFVI